MIVHVDSVAGLLTLGTERFPCQLGRGGTCEASAKREGDGCTPRGAWPVRVALLRPGSGVGPPARLPWRWIRPGDGWSDDPADPAYNRPVRHPHPFSAERLWREDTLYDAVLVLGHNDVPPHAGAGSAIFLHLAGDKSTEGCVAVSRDLMKRLLGALFPGDTILID